MKPICFGGWGIKHLLTLNLSLLEKSLWRALFDSGLWGSIIRRNYLKGVLVPIWLCRSVKMGSNFWAIWRSLCHALPILEAWLDWVLGKGFVVRIGVDGIRGLEDMSYLSQELV